MERKDLIQACCDIFMPMTDEENTVVLLVGSGGDYPTVRPFIYGNEKDLTAILYETAEQSALFKEILINVTEGILRGGL